MKMLNKWNNNFHLSSIANPFSVPHHHHHHHQNGLHVSHLTLKYETSERIEVILDLQLNQELIPDGHFIHYQLPNGQGYAQRNFTLADVDHCHYKVSEDNN